MESLNANSDHIPSETLTKIAESCIVHGIDNQPFSQHAKTKTDVHFPLSSPTFRKMAYDIIGNRLLFVKFTFALVSNQDRKPIRKQIQDLLEQFLDHTELLESLYGESGSTRPEKHAPSIITVEVSDDLSFGWSEEHTTVFLASQQTLQLMFACILRLRDRMNRIDIHAVTATEGGRSSIERALLQMASHIGGIYKLSLKVDGFSSAKAFEMEAQLRTSCEFPLRTGQDLFSLLQQNLTTFLDLVSGGVHLPTLLPTLTTLCDTLFFEPQSSAASPYIESESTNAVNWSYFILIFASMSEHMLRRPNTAEAQGHWFKAKGILTLEKLLYHVARFWKDIRVRADLSDESAICCALLQARAQLYLAFARSAHLHPIKQNVSCDFLTRDHDTFHTARRWMKLANADIRFVEIFFTRSRKLTNLDRLNEWLRVCTNLRDTIWDGLLEDNLFNPIMTDSLSSLIQFEHDTTRYNIWRGTGSHSWIQTLMSNR